MSAVDNKFVHLHVHSEYSLLDGLSKIKGLVRKAKEHESPALALTDHGGMYGAVDFYKVAKAEGIKPIIGCELYMSAGDHTERKRKDAFHLTVWAQNNEGYKNLMKLVSIGQIEGFYYKPRVSFELLKKYGKGLMASSGCPASLINRQLVNEDYKTAKKTTEKFVDIFGEDNFYLEIQRHFWKDYAEQEGVPAGAKKKLLEDDAEMQGLEDKWLKLSRDLGLPLIATNDVHYVEKEDAVAQDAIVCIQTGKMIADEDRMRYIDVTDYYLKSPQEMSDVFADIPEAVNNTLKVADRVDLEITLGEWFFPEFEIPKGKTAGEVLREMSYKGAEELFPEITDEIRERIDFELEVIDTRGFSTYFLLYADMTRFCRETGIYINTRGSAAGSIVSYCCGITTVDPLHYNLPFERFLNPLRPSPPDIDLDISDDRREDMINYLKKTYGEEKVAQICTFGTMQAKASVRDVGRVLGMPYSQPDRIAKMIPLGSQGFPMFLDRAMEESPELKEAYDNEPETKKLIDLARKIEGNARHLSVHAAAVVVGQSELTNFTPLQREPGGGDKIITQYEMHASEDVGLIKLDILGIRNLSIMANAIKLIEELNGVKIDIYKIPLDDKKTFMMLSEGHTFGVFQMASAGMTRYLVELEPTRVEDLMIMVALYRPGPMANISEFIARRHGRSEAQYYHPKMKEFLEPSYGVLVYQDDLLYTALNLAGYNWESVDKFRKAVGKKIPEEMAKQHVIFVDGCVEHSGMTKKEAEGLWSLFEPFQGYGFNKAHAASYGMVSYWTAYLKANYPVEYMAALLSAEANNTDKLVEAIAECDNLDIQILPPDINESGVEFTVVGKGEEAAIRFGLAAIKNVGEAAVEAILEERKRGGEFLRLGDFCTRVDQRKVNKRVLESLIKAGAFDKFGHRAALIEGMDIIRGRAAKKQEKEAIGQSSLFAGVDEGKKEVGGDNLPDVPEWQLRDKLKFEKELLGFFLSDNPVKGVMNRVGDQVTHRINQLDADHHKGQTVTLAGTVSRVKQVMTKKNNEAMAFFGLEDDTGVIDLVVFPRTYAETKELLEVDRPVIVKGKVDIREEQINILVDEIEPVDMSKESVPAIRIEIPRGTDKEVLMKISKLLKETPGERRVQIAIPNGNGPKIIDLPYGVAWDDELDEEIKKVLQS